MKPGYTCVSRSQLHENLLKNLKANLNEAELNELFGFGSPKKPTQELNADYILKASNEELADLMAEYCNYWLGAAGESIDKAVAAPTQALLAACKEKKDAATKTMKAIVTACRKSLTGAYDKSLDAVKSTPRILIMGIAIAVKFGANGVELAVQAGKAIYAAVANWIKETYAKCKGLVEKGWEAGKEKLVLLGKILLAVALLAGNKIAGAAQAFAGVVKQIVEDAANGIKEAVLLVRMWFAAKGEAVAAWTKETVGAARNKVVEAWNGMEKAVTKGWNKAVSAVLDWCNSIRVSVNKLVDKVGDTMNAAGDAIIGAKDKAIVAGIGKAVKMLSNKYSEDDIIAVVRKALKEGVQFESDGTFVINEKYYANTTLKPILG